MSCDECKRKGIFKGDPECSGCSRHRGFSCHSCGRDCTNGYVTAIGQHGVRVRYCRECARDIGAK